MLIAVASIEITAPNSCCTGSKPNPPAFLASCMVTAGDKFSPKLSPFTPLPGQEIVFSDECKKKGRKLSLQTIAADSCFGLLLAIAMYVKLLGMTMPG